MRRILALVFFAGTVPLVASSSALATATSVLSCTSSHLVVSHGVEQGAAGTSYLPIVFTNTGSASCQIWGAPGIQVGTLVKSVFTPVGPAATNRNKGAMGSLHTVKKGGSIAVNLGLTETGNYTPSTCVAKPVNAASVTLGNVVHATLRIPASTVCTKIASTSTGLLGS